MHKNKPRREIEAGGRGGRTIQI